MRDGLPSTWEVVFIAMFIAMFIVGFIRLSVWIADRNARYDSAPEVAKRATEQCEFYRRESLQECMRHRPLVDCKRDVRELYGDCGRAKLEASAP